MHLQETLGEKAKVQEFPSARHSRESERHKGRKEKEILPRKRR